MRIGIAGLAGRMGALLVDAVRGAPGTTLVGGTLRPGSARPGPSGVRVVPHLLELAGECDAVIDFTHAGTAASHAEAIEATGTAWVLGTSGLDAEGENAVRRAAGQAAVIHAANYAPGAALVLALAERLGAALGPEYDAEITETHHRGKRDAPSGTALGLGRAVARGRGHALDGWAERGRDGQVGPRRPGAIGFASLRGGSVVGEHVLAFLGDREEISLHHRATDRRVFADGAVRAALWLGRRKPGFYGMADVLGL